MFKAIARFESHFKTILSIRQKEEVARELEENANTSFNDSRCYSLIHFQRYLGSAKNFWKNPVCPFNQALPVAHRILRAWNVRRSSYCHF